jgi:hypothetical protein
MTLVAVGRSADRRRVGVAGGALVEEIARQRPGRRLWPRSGKRCSFSWSPLKRSVHEVVSVRPKSKPPRALPPRSQCAQRDMLITDGGGTPTPCTMAVVIIRPQAAVEDKDELPTRIF